MKYASKFKLKKNLYALFALTLTLTFISCEKDEDFGSYPSSGSSIEYGCDIYCSNGGVVTPSCDCDCPSGFTGSNCQNQLTPIGFNLTKIEIIEWPNNNGSSYWDSDGSTPDPRIEINLGTTQFLHSGHFYNPSVNTVLSYNSYNDSENFPVSLNASTTYDFRVYDFDNGGSDDMMLNSYFTLTDHDNGLPSVVTFNYSSNGWKFKLYGTWTF